VEAMASYLRKWTQKQYQAYSICMLEFHGTRRDLRRRTTSSISTSSGDAGRTVCRRLMHFDSCETLDIPVRQIEAFRRRTNADAISGYTKDVDWIEAAAFLLELLERVDRLAGDSRWSGIHEVPPRRSNHSVGLPGRVGWRPDRYPGPDGRRFVAPSSPGPSQISAHCSTSRQARRIPATSGRPSRE